VNHTLQKYLSVRNLCVLYLLVYVGVGFQKYLLGGYNNYLMFTMPFGWMLEGKTLYEYRVFLFEDLYKYSPTFAYLMGAFHPLPIGVGVVLWNLLNTLVLLVGTLRFLEGESERTKRAVLLIVFLEGLISAQNIQSNNLILGLMLLGLSDLRRERVVRAALWMSLCVVIKFYGAAVAIFFIFYPKKVKFLCSMAGWTLLLALLPLGVLSFDSLVSEYQRWLEVAATSKLKQQVSVMGILESWLGLKVNFEAVALVGFGLFVLPFVRMNLWQNTRYQRLMLAYLLTFIIIFNKSAESPTYVYAVMGVALWFVAQRQPTRFDWVLLLLVVVGTSLTPSDLFPRSFRQSVLVPYNIKALPVVLVWLRLQWELWTLPAATTTT
jgi:hypothetical protein